MITYHFFGIRQALPLLCHANDHILCNHVLEIAMLESFGKVQEVCCSRALDQSAIVKLGERSLSKLCQSPAGMVRFLDLQRSVPLKPFVEGSNIGGFVSVGSSNISLFTDVSWCPGSGNHRVGAIAPLSALD